MEMGILSLMSGQPIRFVIAAYGNRYVGLLLTCLYSITQSNPNAQATILWKQISAEKISLIQRAFPTYEFVESTHIFETGTTTVRIAQKTYLWQSGALRYPNERRIFIDVDTLVLKDIGHFFEEHSFDIGFTRKEDLYPLNTGVLLVQGKAGTLFFDEWVERTEQILADPVRTFQATSRKFLYGGADQMALYQFISYTPEKTDFSGTTTQGVSIRFRAFPCAVLNFVHSSPITPDMHIIHYKSGLQKILIDGTGFTGKRTKEDSWDMYIHYLRNYRNAVDYVALHTNTPATYQSWRIRTPFYFTKELAVVPFLYKVFSIKEAVRQRIHTMLMRTKVRYLQVCALMQGDGKVLSQQIQNERPQE